MNIFLPSDFPAFLNGDADLDSKMSPYTESLVLVYNPFAETGKNLNIVWETDILNSAE